MAKLTKSPPKKWKIMVTLRGEEETSLFEGFLESSTIRPSDGHAARQLIVERLRQLSGAKAAR